MRCAMIYNGGGLIFDLFLYLKKIAASFLKQKSNFFMINITTLFWTDYHADYNLFKLGVIRTEHKINITNTNFS